MTTADALTDDWDALVDGLSRYLRLRSIPIGMKLFETVEEMEAIPKIRRPRAKHTTDQIVAQAPEGGILHIGVRAHLETFLREAADRGEGVGVPQRVAFWPTASRGCAARAAPWSGSSRSPAS